MKEASILAKNFLSNNIQTTKHLCVSSNQGSKPTFIDNFAIIKSAVSHGFHLYQNRFFYSAPQIIFLSILPTNIGIIFRSTMKVDAGYAMRHDFSNFMKNTVCSSPGDLINRP